MKSKSYHLLWAIVVIVAVFAVLYIFVKPSSQIPSVDLGQTCIGAGGNWVAEYNECEYISEEACTTLGGEFNECGSACRHVEGPAPCILQCVQFCAF